MPAEWEQEFDFYAAQSKGRPISVLIDMAAQAHAPVPALPLSMTLRIRMNRPTPEGLRSDAEFDALVSLEEEVRCLMDDSVPSVYWGHRIGDGRTDIRFYVQQLPEDVITAPLMPFLSSSGFAGDFRWSQDPDWLDYQAAFPNAYLRQTMSNRDLQDELERRGDRLSERRRVDHVAYFATPEAARNAARRLKRAGFASTRSRRPDESEQYPLEFHRRDSIDGSRPDQVTSEILDCIEPDGGEYDGWGCTLQT